MEVETKEGEVKEGAAEQPTPQKEGEKMETEEAKKDDTAKDAVSNFLCSLYQLYFLFYRIIYAEEYLDILKLNSFILRLSL